MANNNSVEKTLDFRKIYAIVKKNWMVLSSDPLRLRVLFIFPLVMILLFGFTAGKTPKHIPAAIADYDKSEYSGIIQAQLYSNELFSISRLVGSQDEGKKLIESGEVKILFVIPPGFGEDIDAGRTPGISVIIDESDPSIAQVTRAFTRVFIQGVSNQVNAQRVAILSQNARGFSQYLSDVRAAAADGRKNEQAIANVYAGFIDSKYAASQTDRMVAQTYSKMRNNLGMIFDPNEIVDDYERNASTRSATYALLTASDAQQQTLSQMATYRGFAAAGDRIARDAATMYGSSRELYLSSLEQGRQLAISAKIIDSASMKAKDLADFADSIPPTAISLNEIEPYGSGRPGLDFLIPSILALIVFQGAVMGMGRAIAGERQDGSLTRVFLTPTSNITIIAGTLLFYMLFETLRSSLVVFAAVIIFGVTIKGSLLSILFLITIYAAGATGLGMVLSVMARTQEQYMALSMIISLPSMFLAGVFLPVETMPPALQGVTKVLPITYASDALRGVIIKGFSLSQVVPDIVFLCIFALATLVLSVLMFKRELL